MCEVTAARPHGAQRRVGPGRVGKGVGPGRPGSAGGRDSLPPPPPGPSPPPPEGPVGLGISGHCVAAAQASLLLSTSSTPQCGHVGTGRSRVRAQAHRHVHSPQTRPRDHCRRGVALPPPPPPTTCAGGGGGGPLGSPPTPAAGLAPSRPGGCPACCSWKPRHGVPGTGGSWACAVAGDTPAPAEGSEWPPPAGARAAPRGQSPFPRDLRPSGGGAWRALGGLGRVPGAGGERTSGARGAGQALGPWALAGALPRRGVEPALFAHLSSPVRICAHQLGPLPVVWVQWQGPCVQPTVCGGVSSAGTGTGAAC